MADSLVRRRVRSFQKWTYLTWCDLRNHPLTLVGALLGAIAFGVYIEQQSDTNKRIGGVERTVKIPRRCTVAHLENTPKNVVILFCNPATKREIAAAKKKAARAATLRPKRARTKSETNRPLPRVIRESPNGNPGITPPSSGQPPSRSPPAGSPSGGGSRPAPSPPPPQRAAPGVTTPPLGPIPSLTVPLPSLPPLPLGQLTGR